MTSGLMALLDDVAGIAKLAAASLVEMGGAAGKAGAKAVGVVIDDAAVTPGYVIGFAPERELPIIWKIAKGSLRNKFMFLLPGALLLSAFAPWAVTPLLMLGGAYLCLEGSEKVLEALLGGHAQDTMAGPPSSSAELETQKIAGAIRTDMILSAEIMAIALAEVASRPLALQAGALAMVGLAITIGVYGVVGLIVKMDDAGLLLARGSNRVTARLGQGLVLGMPVVMSALSKAGTAAMLWVGGGIIIHGLDHFGLRAIPHAVEGLSQRAAAFGAVMGWATTAAASAAVALALGSILFMSLAGFRRLLARFRTFICLR